MYIIGTVDRIAAAAVPHALHTSPVRAAHTQAKQLHDPQIHILGIGNLGKFFAHSLAIKPSPPPLTLLLHRASLAKEWDDAGKCIDIITNGSSNKKHGFSIEILGDVLDPSVAPGGIIENVIVATKATHTASALALIKGRLNERSTVLFTQNGMGTCSSHHRKKESKTLTLSFSV
jgi:2-dehydropantoate 2-reductase